MRRAAGVEGGRSHVPSCVRGRARARVAAAGAALALASGLLSGCTAALGASTSGGDQKGYVGADGAWKWVAPNDRGAPVQLTGTTETGSRADVADWRGSVVVLNVWYDACAPCQAEAPDLAKVARADPSVHFLGINTHDSADTVKAFDRVHSMPYPSVLDADSGAALVALHGTLPASAVPSTVVLDRQGRPAARIIGRADPSVLAGFIQDVEAGTLTPRGSTSAGSAGGASSTASGAS